MKEKFPSPSVHSSYSCIDQDLWKQVVKEIKPLVFKEVLFPSVKGDEFLKASLKKKQAFSTMNFRSLLDLHGLTHEQAYQQLKDFIQKAFVKKIKHLTIVTGKGISKQPSFMVDKPEKADLLQIQVPRWLELFPQVKNVQQATQEKGGAGVLWVTLKIKK